MNATECLEALLNFIAAQFPTDSMLSHLFYVRGILAVLIVCFICGSVGSLVVGNRMAFFSDALAHCAFAGVALGLLIGLTAGQLNSKFIEQYVPLIMAAFGIAVGLGIAFVRERTGLSSDTVIGVFFAGAIGLGAMLFQALTIRSAIQPENFLFGDAIFVTPHQVLVLMVLAIITTIVLLLINNSLVFASFNASLARSRQIPLRFLNYLFICLLALIVNLCLWTVGALLINALLIVPAATAANLARNLRQMYWLTIGLSLTAGIAGPLLSQFDIPNPNPGGAAIHFGWSGTIVVVSVAIFFLSMAIVSLRKRLQRQKMLATP